MISDHNTRLVIIGNSGAGKSTLADCVGSALSVPVQDLDHLHWLSNGRKRDEAEAKRLVADVAAETAWVIEGVYGWLAQVALQRATGLVWLDLPWAECRDGLLTRGLRRSMTNADQDALIAWASAYWTRTTPSSFEGHRRLYHAFDGVKARPQARTEAFDLWRRMAATPPPPKAVC